MSTGQYRPSSDVPHMVSSECEALLSSKCLVLQRPFPVKRFASAFDVAGACDGLVVPTPIRPGEDEASRMRVVGS